MRLRERFEKQLRELEESEKERKTQLISLLNYEQQLSELKRDLDLKDIKIESLENVMKKRDQQVQEHSS